MSGASTIYEDFAPLLDEVPPAYQPGCKAVLKQALEKALPETSGGIVQCIMQGKTLQPIEYKVIVLPDLIEETDEAIKRFKTLGMELPAAERERDKQKQITGTLVSVGGNAFSDMAEPLPRVGDKVYFAKYAGLTLKADDDTEFRLMNDKDITAVLT